MSKPEDIPQDVWDVAWGLVCDSEAVKVPYYAMGGELDVARKLDALYIARAILAAKAEERAVCLANVTDQAPGWVRKKEGEYWDGYRDAIDDAAIDIRKRGEG